MRKKVIWTAACCLALGCSLAACVPQVEEGGQDQQDATPTTAGEVTEKVHDGGIESIDEGSRQLNEAYSTVKTLEDGTQVQLAPETNGQYVFTEQPNSYNGYWLNAANRGCVSCHESGLGDLVENKMPYKHFEITNNLGTEVTPMDCRICHDETAYTMPKANTFGELIHGIHSKDSFEGNCMSCHTASSNDKGMQLWEEAKYDVMRGMSFLPNVQGDFNYDQDTTSDMFNLSWPNESTLPGTPLDHVFNNDPNDDATFESWEITVSGEVENPYTITLGELVKEAPSETFISSAQCVNNPPGGELVANVEVKAIPLMWILDKAGLKDNATVITTTDAQGYGSGVNLISNVQTEGGWLVYEINGERLSWRDGFPCRAWYPDHSVPIGARWLSDIIITDTPADEVTFYEGWSKETGQWIGDEEKPEAEFMNSPNVGIMHTHEGEIIPVGEPYEFQGYADAFNEQVAALEFSLDRGETWTKFDTSDSDKTKWVYWHFNYTPEEAGTYVLSVRAISSEGRVTPYPDEIMFNAK